MLTKEQALAVTGYTGHAAIDFDVFLRDLAQRLGRKHLTMVDYSSLPVADIRAVYRNDFMKLFHKSAVSSVG